MRDLGKQMIFAGMLRVTLALVAGTATAAAGNFQLVDAAKNQDRSTVRALLNQHIDVNARADDGSTALLWAAHWDDLETAGALLHAGADPNTANDFRMTPLSQACVNGSAALVASLLNAGANPNTPIGTGETPLMTCAKSGNADAVRTLIAHDAAINAKEPVQNQTALMWAAAEHHPDVVKMLIDAKADLQAHSKKGFTALHFAAREGDQESARLLLAAGLNVNTPTQPDAGKRANRLRRRRALVERDSGEGITRVQGTRDTRRCWSRPSEGKLRWRSSCSIKERTPTPVKPVTRRCIGRQPPGKVDTSNPVYGIEDPMSGIPDRQAKLQLVKALLAHGANPNARMTVAPPSFASGYTDTVGATPFLLASSVDDLEMMRILLAAGADPENGDGNERDCHHGGDGPSPRYGGKPGD